MLINYNAAALLIMLGGVLLFFTVVYPVSKSKIAEIPACVETDPIYPDGDADDPAIWVDRVSPAHSVVISTDKSAGLHVYDLAGRELQFVPLGKTNNVDLRPDFAFRDGLSPIIAVTNMTDQTVVLLRFDHQARRINPEPVAKIPNFRGESGVCLYRSKGGSMHVGTSGEHMFRQWRLDVQSNGTITIKLVRSFKLSSQAEACAYDDALGRLYIAEEEVGIWRLSAEPENGDAATLVDAIDAKGDFPSDVEGLAIFARNDGTGYLVASNQGNSTFRLYRREGDNSYLGRFRVVGCEDDSVDATTKTDGIEVVSVSLGPKWPSGMLVIHDGGNLVDSNFPNLKDSNIPNLKYVRWDEIERRMFDFRDTTWQGTN
jgi:3-phytase